MITKFILPLACACLIAILEILAILRGLDGTCLGLAIAGIAGLGGYGLSQFLSKKKE
jgi:hypothetical protein